MVKFNSITIWNILQFIVVKKKNKVLKRERNGDKGRKNTILVVRSLGHNKY